MGANLLLPPANEVCEGDDFTPVCQSFCSQRWGSTWAGTPPPRQVHPPGRYTPWAGTPPRQVHLPGRYTPLGRYTPPWQVHPPRQVHPPGQVHSPLAVTPPGIYTPLGRYNPQAGTPSWQVHPLAGTTPGRYNPRAGTPPGSYACGRYACYWNSFLFGIIFAENCIKMKNNWTEGAVSLAPPRSTTVLVNMTSLRQSAI